MSTEFAYLRVRVIPRASRAAIGRDQSGTLRVHLTAAPVDGAANRALLALLAKTLDIPQRALTLARGERARDKVVRVDGDTQAVLDARIACRIRSSVDKAKRRDY
jgi:uncharacterized protein YggU (UPF0235/DUF167 family)